MLAKITLTSVAALMPGDVIEDAELKGFSVRSWRNTVVYSVRGRLNGQRIRINIGRHGPFTPHTARREAMRLLGLLASNQDPRADRAKPLTFAQAAQAFLEHITARRSPGTAREYSGHLQTHLIPRLGRKPLTNITTSDLAKLHLDLADRPFLANRVLSTTSSLFGWADRRGLVPDLFNPARRVERYPEQSKERFLSEAELQRLGQVLRDFESSNTWSPFALAAIRLLLFTGCRRDEIRLLRWLDIDWDRAQINLSRSKTGKRVIHLNSGAVAILRKLRARPDDGNDYVIRGVKPDEPYKNLQDVWEVVRERAQLADVRLHDLRHSVASFAGAEGASLALIGALLGHKSPAATTRYVHLAGDPARALAHRVGAKVGAKLDPDGVPEVETERQLGGAIEGKV